MTLLNCSKLMLSAPNFSNAFCEESEQRFCDCSWEFKEGQGTQFGGKWSGSGWLMMWWRLCVMCDQFFTDLLDAASFRHEQRFWYVRFQARPMQCWTHQLFLPPVQACIHLNILPQKFIAGKFPTSKSFYSSVRLWGLGNFLAKRHGSREMIRNSDKSFHLFSTKR